MSDLIRIKRGLQADLPELMQGELGLTLDTEKLYVGGLNGNLKANNPQFPSEKLGKGQASGNIFISTEGSIKEIDVVDSVAMHVVTGSRTDYENGGIEYPRVWGFNTIVAKHEDFPTSFVCGMEVSMVNATADHSNVIGVLSSYVGTGEGAKSAFESTGNIAGWGYGLIVDAIKPQGTGILFEDLAPAIFGGAAGGGMNIGIDFSQVTTYSTAAILLGNNQTIAARNSAAIAKPVFNLTGNTLIIGSDMGVFADGYTIIRSCGEAVQIQHKNSDALASFDSGLNPVSLFMGGAMHRVEIGDPDSGGVGYRMLRTVN